MPSEARGGPGSLGSAPLRRCYLGTDLSTLQRWRDAGETPAGVGAVVVTPEFREVVGPADDEEEYEHAAAVAAADAALSGVAGVAVVLAADVPDLVVRPAPAAGPGGVVLTAAVPVRRWAAVFAVDPVPDGAAGADGEPVLSWYAVTELDTIA